LEEKDMQRQTLRIAQFVGLLAAPLLISLAGNLFLLQRSRSYERLFHMVRLDPLGTNAFEEETMSLDPTTQTRVVFYGDSRAAFWTKPALPGVQIVNRGVPGHSTLQALLGFDQLIAPLEPDIVLIQVGVNDLTAIGMFPQQRDRIVNDTREQIIAAVERSQSIGARVILTTIFPAAGTGWFRDDRLQAAITEINAALVELAGPDVVVFDTAAVLTGPDGFVRPAYAEDELHLSAAGYAALNEALVPLLSAE
jgi:lysophospholipase L1-like esterase